MAVKRLHSEMTGEQELNVLVGDRQRGVRPCTQQKLLVRDPISTERSGLFFANRAPSHSHRTRDMIWAEWGRRALREVLLR